MRLINLVASGSLHQAINLENLRELGDRYSYDSKKYHGAYIRLNLCKVTIYKSGKYIFTGLKNPELLDCAWAEFSGCPSLRGSTSTTQNILSCEIWFFLRILGALSILIAYISRLGGLSNMSLNNSRVNLFSTKWQGTHLLNR